MRLAMKNYARPIMRNDGSVDYVEQQIKMYSIPVEEFRVDEDGPEGAVIARFANIGQRDSYNDTLKKGSIKKQNVYISHWNHSIMYELPAGIGAIGVNDDQDGIFKGQFWLDTFNGEQSYRVVKNTREYSKKHMEWSFYFYIIDEEPIDYEDGTSGFLIRKTDIFEVSPVFRGASASTATLDLKGDDYAAELMKLDLRYLDQRAKELENARS